MKKIYSKKFCHYIMPDCMFKNSKKVIRLLSIDDDKNLFFIDKDRNLFSCSLESLEKNYREAGVGFYSFKDIFESDMNFSDNCTEKNIELQLDLCWNCLSRIHQKIEMGENTKNLLDEIMDTLDTCFEIGLTRRTTFCKKTPEKEKEAQEIFNYFKENKVPYKKISQKFHCSMSKISKIINGRL